PFIGSLQLASWPTIIVRDVIPDARTRRGRVHWPAESLDLDRREAGVKERSPRPSADYRSGEAKGQSGSNWPLPIVRLRDMESVFAESIRRPRLLAQLLGAFAGLALLHGAVGTYAVLSYMATERRREIGIRIALGAGRSSVLALVVKQGLQLTIIGVVVGLAGALGLNRLIASVLFGVQPTDPTTLAAVIMTITLVAAGAGWLPA